MAGRSVASKKRRSRPVLRSLRSRVESRLEFALHNTVNRKTGSGFIVESFSRRNIVVVLRMIVSLVLNSFIVRVVSDVVNILC